MQLTEEETRLCEFLARHTFCSVGDAVKVKAAGGIRTPEAMLAMIEAGAERIGTSSGVKIIDALRGQDVDNTANAAY